MTRDEMLAIDNAVRDAIGDGDLDAFDRLMAPDLAAEFREGLAELKRAFGDYSGVNENGQTGPVHGHRDEPVRGQTELVPACSRLTPGPSTQSSTVGYARPSRPPLGWLA